MLTIPPQKIPAGVDPALFVALRTAMPSLVPNKNRGGNAVHLDVQPWIQSIERDRPPGGTRECLIAALKLLAGDLDGCHTRCQNVPSIYGSAWHAAMHRQEGDFWNSKYWSRRAGGMQWDRLNDLLPNIADHMPPGIRKVCDKLLRAYDPAHFVDIVEANENNAEARESLLDLQRWEWASLFLATWESTV